MKALVLTTHVDRSPETVWTVMTDLSRSASWRPLVRSMTTSHGGPLAAGTAVDITAEIMGRTLRRRSMTTVFEPPRRWVLRSESNDVEGLWDYAIAPEAGGSRVSLTLELNSRRFLRRLILPLLARNERRIRVDQLERLKHLVESSTH
jgi:hypothetical protein